MSSEQLRPMLGVTKVVGVAIGVSVHHEQNFELNNTCFHAFKLSSWRRACIEELLGWLVLLMNSSRRWPSWLINLRIRCRERRGRWADFRDRLRLMVNSWLIILLHSSPKESNNVNAHIWAQT